jgi:hypothetical protein
MTEIIQGHYLGRMADTGSTNDNKTDISALQSKPDKFSQFFNA